MQEKHYFLQDHLADEIVGDIQKFKMYEAPTGFGKTHVLLKAAARIIKRYGKKVIISTANNNLVRDMYETSQNFDFGIGSDAFSIIIGKSNYIDLNKLNTLVNSNELYDFITKESYQNWLECVKDETILFFDRFDELVEYKDQARARELQNLISFSSRPETAGDFNTSFISITNHFYLLYRAAMAKNIDLSDYYILMDEVHEIVSAAESVFEASFSPFNLKNLSSRLEKELEKSDFSWKGKKTLSNTLSGIMRKMDSVVRSGITIAGGNVGEYLIDGKGFDYLLNEAVNFYKSDSYAEFGGTINKALNIFERDEQARFKQEIGLIYAIKKEMGELASISRAKNISIGKGVGIYLSPTKGYPTFKALKDDPLSVLHFNFWEKLDGFAGLSATLLTDTKTNEKGHNYAYRRLGISAAKTSPIKQYNRVFPKELVKVFMPEQSFIDPVSLDADEEKKAEWVSFVSQYIKQHYAEKNTLVLCGGYAEAKHIAEALTMCLPDENIICATPTIQTSQTIRQFEREGGILVAVRNYGTGISLEGEKLERLFVLRLPYPVYTSKMWLDLKHRQPQYFWGKYINEMLISLRQGIGRLQRTPTDEGEIHILDSRIFVRNQKKRGKYLNPELKRRIWHFAGQYGILVKGDHLSSLENNANETTLVSLSEQVKKKDDNSPLDWLE